VETDRKFRLGVAFAGASALTFGTSGPFAKSLMAAGWTPTVAVVARLAAGALVMALVATVVHRGWLREVVPTVRRSCCTGWSRSRALSSATTTRCRTCRSVSRCCWNTSPHPRGRLGVGDNATATRLVDARGCCDSADRHCGGARRFHRDSRRRDRRRLGAGGDDLCCVLSCCPTG
jgi:hypothetical protein